MTTFWMYAALGLLTAGPVSAQSEAPAPVPANSDGSVAKPVKEKKICRREQTTGSIMARQTCHSRDEWAAIDGANQASAQQTLAHRGATSN